MLNVYRIGFTIMLVRLFLYMDGPLSVLGIIGWSAAALIFMVLVIVQARREYDATEWLVALLMGPLLVSLGVYLFVSREGWGTWVLQIVTNIVPQWLVALNCAIVGILKFVRP